MKKAYLFNENNEFTEEVNAQLDPLATEFYKKEIVFNKLPTLNNLKNTILNRLILKSIPSFTFNLPKRVVNHIKYYQNGSISTCNRPSKIIFHRHSTGGAEF